MRAIRYTQAGGPDVLELVEMANPDPGPGQVRVAVAVSAVNPTDWKSRSNTTPAAGFQIPNQDGSGTVDAVGAGVDAALVGQRVWLREAAKANPFGTAADFSVLPADRVGRLPDNASFDVGADLGVPFLTAHRCLTLGDLVPDRLGPGALAGIPVLVQGGAGAVGNAAIQLARWSGATVITTVSGPEKGRLAAAAGAEHVIDYRTQDVVEAVRRIAPDGVAAIVEVAVAVNAELDGQILATHGAVASYADTARPTATLAIRPQMALNARWEFVLLYAIREAVKQQAMQDVSDALRAAAIRVGPDAGLPLHRFALADTAAAHQAVQEGVVGKVLIDVR